MKRKTAAMRMMKKRSVVVTNKIWMIKKKAEKKVAIISTRDSISFCSR